MEERLLNTFLTAARLGSFSRAAQVLYVAQSTVTARIKELEQVLGSPLFRREGRSLSLTEEGRIFVRYAQRSLQALEDGRAAVAAMRPESGHQVRLMASHLPAAYDLPHLLEPEWLAGEEPPLSVRIGPSKRIFRSMLQGETDIGLVSIRFRHPSVESEVVAERALVVVAAPGCRGPGLPILFFEEEIEDALLVRSVAHQLGWGSSRCIGIGDLAALKAILSRGLGIGLLPREAVEAELDQGLLIEAAGEEARVLPAQITCLMVRSDTAGRPDSRFFNEVITTIRGYYAGRRQRQAIP